MIYILVFLVGLAVVAIALLRDSAYVAGIAAFATALFFIVWPAYHFFTWETPWLIVTVFALVWAIRSRSTWSRAALILSAGVLIILTVGASWWTFLLMLLAAVIAFVERDRSTGLWKFLASATVAVATLAMVMTGNPVAPTLFGTAVAAEQPGDPSNLAIQPGELLPDAAKCTNGDTLNPSSMPDTKGRVWGDSVSTPFKSTSKDGQFKELTREICTNPALGDAYAQALGDAKIGSFSVLGANPWLRDFLKESSGTDGLKVWLTHKDSSIKTIYVTKSYQDNAQMVNALLFALDNQGTKTAPSTVNWPLNTLVADTLPRAYKETSKNKQENLPFMALTFTQKAGGCPYVLGVNLKDKRPENVNCQKAKEIAPKKPTTPRLTVTPPGKGGSTPTPTPSGTPTKPGHTPSSPSPSHTPKPCPPGYTGKPGHCLEQKDGNVIPTNPHHTPAGQHTESAKPPVHPSQKATTGTAGSESTQQAEGSTPKPKPSETAPHAGDPTSTATACIPDPDSGKGC